MNEFLKIEGTKLEKYLAEIEKEHPIHNDEELIDVLNTIILEESDRDVVSEAIEFYFYVKGYDVDEIGAPFNDEKKRLLEDLK